MTLFATRFASDGGTRLDGAVEMIHGSGGRATTELVRTLFHRHFDNAYLAQGNDQAAFDMEAARVVMTTDAHVVSPLFFPGGDIGSLAVHGTINYVAMAGVRPAYPSAAAAWWTGLRATPSQGFASHACAAPHPQLQ